MLVRLSPYVTPGEISNSCVGVLFNTTSQPEEKAVLAAQAAPFAGHTETLCPRLMASLRAKFKPPSKLLISPLIRTLAIALIIAGKAIVDRMPTMARTITISSKVNPEVLRCMLIPGVGHAGGMRDSSLAAPPALGSR